MLHLHLDVLDMRAALTAILRFVVPESIPTDLMVLRTLNREVAAEHVEQSVAGGIW